MNHSIHLNGYDLAIFIVYLFLAVGLGFVVSIGRKKTTRGYFLGGKTLPWFVIACSMLASDVSSEHFIANAGSGYTYGIVSATASWNCWIIYSIFIWIFLPYFVRTNLYTIPEFLERRYSATCRYVFSASLVAGYVGAILAGTLYAGGLAFERTIGPFLGGSFSDEHRQVVLGIVFFAVVTGAYTIYGGLRSAAWTDFMQIIVLGIGGTLVPILGLRAAGGSHSLVHEYPLRFQVFLPVDHPKFPFTGVFTGFLTVGIWYTCTSQHMVQRVLAAKDEWHARMGVIGAGFLHIITPFFFVFPGFLGYKLLGPNLSQPDTVYLQLVQQLVGTGLRGLILAAMAAALMSNLSAVLNSASTLITLDFYKTFFKPDSSDEQQVRFGQFAGRDFGAARQRWRCVVLQPHPQSSTDREGAERFLLHCAAVFGDLLCRALVATRQQYRRAGHHRRRVSLQPAVRPNMEAAAGRLSASRVFHVVFLRIGDGDRIEPDGGAVI